MLGNIFKTERVIGPFSITHLKLLNNIDLYTIGEIHEMNGAAQAVVDESLAPYHVVEHLRKFCEDASQRVHIFAETTPTEAQGMIGGELLHEVYQPKFVLFAPNPIAAFSYSMFCGCFQANVSITLSDVRKTRPYDLFMLIMHPNIFAIERYEFQSISMHIAQVRKWAKVAEKAFIKNLNSKLNTRSLMECFYLPDTISPPWLQTLYRTIYGDANLDDEFSIRRKMKALRERDGEKYAYILQYLDERWANLQTGSDSFSEAMADVENARRSDSLKLMAERDGGLLQIFISLSSFLYDLDIILDILEDVFEKKHKNHSIVTLTGAQHAGHIARFFEHFAISKVSKASSNGDLAAGNGILTILYAKDISIKNKLKEIRERYRNPDTIKL